MKFCQTCHCTDCNSHCARSTDMQAIEEQYQRDCVAVDADAEPRLAAKEYCDSTREIVVPEICEAVLSLHAKEETLKAVRAAEVSAFIAGAKWACGVRS